MDEIDTIHKVENYLSQEKDNIIVCDIDNTLIHPSTVLERSDQYGSEQWGVYSVIQKQKNGVHTQRAKQCIKQKYQEFVHNEMIPIAVEEQAPEYLNTLRAYAYLYILSARDIELKDVTLRQLDEIGVTLDGVKTEAWLCDNDNQSENAKEVPMYTHGAVLSGKNKGSALIQLIKYLYRYIPQNVHIIFIDDKQSAVDSVARACRRHHLSCNALRYSVCDQYVKQLLPSHLDDCHI